MKAVQHSNTLKLKEKIKTNYEKLANPKQIFNGQISLCITVYRAANMIKTGVNHLNGQSAASIKAITHKQASVSYTHLTLPTNAEV